MLIFSDTLNKLLHIQVQEECGQLSVCDTQGFRVEVPLISRTQKDGLFELLADASRLHVWHPDTPVLYDLSYGNEKTRFGFCNIRPYTNKQVLFNDNPIYLRGYIRGIVAHEHPNMTGGTLKDAAVKNIRQAKKYGFNLVRFHSTIPTPEFVEAADEEGMLIHLEIGFAYEYNSKGEKQNLSMSNEKWTGTILQYRNHPSIAIFCIGNEMHNSGHFPEVRALYEEGKRLAPGKLIMDNSGWGEFDRTTADIFSQHIAYFFPYKHHADMFTREDPWLLNGSATDAPMNTPLQNGLKGCIHRNVVPVRPVIAHEACHYIDVPDYEALNRKFDAFCAKAGEKYLQENGIEKPRYMTALPELIRRKGLQQKLPDYIAASQQFKMFALKTFLEKCRMSGLCGFEMLQFADCLKYENKNGIVDCFDDDKYIPAEWMKQFNGNAALLAELENVVFFFGDEVKGSIYLSDFLPEPEISDGALTLKLIRDDGNSKFLYSGDSFIIPGGLQKLISFSFSVDEEKTGHQYTLSAEFNYAGGSLKNEWKIWVYPHQKISADKYVTADHLSDELFADLEQGKTVFLFYHRDRKTNQYYWPGALERFKPCIWDRGSNLGGIIYSETLQKHLACGRYFEENLQPLLEAGYKICLDDFPVPVNEIICGVDKPVRDRMKGLLHGVKDFIDQDTLRNFSHLFSLKVGKGLLVVCTLQVNDVSNPVTANLLDWLFHAEDELKTDKSISLESLKEYLTIQTEAGVRKEDVMNHFWEIDNKLVEDKLFWEEAHVDLSKHK